MPATRNVLLCPCSFDQQPAAGPLPHRPLASDPHARPPFQGKTKVEPVLVPCKRSNPRQKWYFGDFSPYGKREARQEMENYGYVDAVAEDSMAADGEEGGQLELERAARE